MVSASSNSVEEDLKAPDRLLAGAEKRGGRAPSPSARRVLYRGGSEDPLLAEQPRFGAEYAHGPRLSPSCPCPSVLPASGAPCRPSMTPLNTTGPPRTCARPAGSPRHRLPENVHGEGDPEDGHGPAWSRLIGCCGRAFGCLEAPVRVELEHGDLRTAQESNAGREHPEAPIGIQQHSFNRVKPDGIPLGVPG